jgi:hypothetical protein
MHDEFSEHGMRPAMNPETSNVCFDRVWLLSFGESEQNSSPCEIQPWRLRLRGLDHRQRCVGMRPLVSRLGMHRMSDSNDRRDDEKRQLECLRLASDLRQLAKDTLNPELKAHCLRMAKQWSGEPPAKDDTRVDRGPVH